MSRPKDPNAKQVRSVRVRPFLLDFNLGAFIRYLEDNWFRIRERSLSEESRNELARELGEVVLDLIDKISLEDEYKSRLRDKGIRLTNQDFKALCMESDEIWQAVLGYTPKDLGGLQRHLLEQAFG